MSDREQLELPRVQATRKRPPPRPKELAELYARGALRPAHKPQKRKRRRSRAPQQLALAG